VILSVIYLRASMIAVFWWWWRRRCCSLVTVIFYVPFIVANNWINCLNRVRCAPHWNIAFRSCLIFCELLRTNDIFVYNICYNIMIKQTSSNNHVYFRGFILCFVFFFHFFLLACVLLCFLIQF